MQFLHHPLPPPVELLLLLLQAPPLLLRLPPELETISGCQTILIRQLLIQLVSELVKDPHGHLVLDVSPAEWAVRLLLLPLV